MNEIVVRDKLPVSTIADMEKIGDIMCRSGMFGCENKEQGIVLAMNCLQSRMSLLEFDQTFSMIQGRPSKKADAILADLHRLGGLYKIVQRDGDAAEVVIEYKGNSVPFRFEWKEAQGEKYIYQKDGRTLKDNWSTPRRRAQMMWARVVSDGCRAVCPQACKGMYTPEEVVDFTDRDTALTHEGQVVDVTPGPAEKPEGAVKGETVIPPETEKPAAEKLAAKPGRGRPKGAAKKTEPKADPEVDYGVMPIGKHKDKKWEEFETKLLKQVLLVNRKTQPLLTDGHMERVKLVLKQREDYNASKDSDSA